MENDIIIISFQKINKVMMSASKEEPSVFHRYRITIFAFPVSLHLPSASVCLITGQMFLVFTIK